MERTESIDTLKQSPSKKLYHERKSWGLCPSCGRTRDADGLLCKFCLIMHRISYKITHESWYGGRGYKLRANRMRKRKERKQCVRCGRTHQVC